MYSSKNMVFLLRKIVNGRFLLTFLIFLIFVFCFLKLSGIKQKKRVKFKASSSAETIEPTTKEQCDLIPSGLIGVFDIIAPPELDFFSQDTKLRLRGVENGSYFIKCYIFPYNLSNNAFYLKKEAHLLLGHAIPKIEWL